MTVSLDVNDPDAPRRYWFYYKHSDWRFEEEARVVFPIDTPGPTIQFAPTSLTRIILGKNGPCPMGPTGLQPRSTEWGGRSWDSRVPTAAG